MKLGRKDSKTASLSAANSGVIPPPTSTLANLINRFQARGLSTKDMVVLSGISLLYIYLSYQLSFLFFATKLYPCISLRNIKYIRNVERAKREFRYKIDRRDFPVIYLIYIYT